MSNSNLLRARKQKNDEFYTRLEDIASCMDYYAAQLKGKTIYCNCDDYRISNFVRYFHDNFERLALRRLIATNYDLGTGAYLYAYDGVSTTIISLKGNGDFRSDECVELLDEADIVITNPPFSLFREYVAQLVEHGKKFLIIGNKNAITYKEIFPLIKSNKLWLGYNAVKSFKQPDGSFKQFGNIGWFTNLDVKNRHEPIDLYKKYTPDEYPKYDNYDAIEVPKVKLIPRDYDGIMGVPITFLDKYCPEQFEILGISSQFAVPVTLPNGHKGTGRFYLNGRMLYDRMVIRKQPDFDEWDY